MSNCTRNIILSHSDGHYGRCAFQKQHSFHLRILVEEAHVLIKLQRVLLMFPSNATGLVAHQQVNILVTIKLQSIHIYSDASTQNSFSLVQIPGQQHLLHICILIPPSTVTPAPHGCVFHALRCDPSRYVHAYTWTHRDGSQRNG